MLVIPAIDILNNKVVRLKKGDYNQVTEYSDSPVKQAQIFKEIGFGLIHVINLTGSRDGKFSINDLLKIIKNEIQIQIQFGGGIRSIDDVESLFEIGIDKIILGSLSITNKPEIENITSFYDPKKIIIAADVLNDLIRVKGWTENSGIKLIDHIKYCCDLGIQEYLCTDISRDGVMKGPNIELYKNLQKEFPGIKLIVSGGIRNLSDIKILNSHNFHAAVVGKAIYENKINLKELKQFVN